MSSLIAPFLLTLALALHPAARPAARAQSAPRALLALPAGPTAADAATVMLGLVNDERRAYGLHPLVLDDALSAIARWRSADMRDRHYFAHLIPGLGCLVFCVLDQDHIAYSTSGENIIWSSALDLGDVGSSMAALNAWWMHSPEHRANLLDPDFTRIGIGFAQTPTGVIYGTEDFTG